MPLEPERLDSWKLIAAHLGRDVTTAIRWEKEKGLPVHRVPGGKLSRVFAYTDELDDWLRRAGEHSSGTGVLPVQPVPAPPPERRLSFAFRAAGAAVVLAAGVMAVGWPHVTEATAVSVDGNGLIGRTPSGSTAWVHPFDAATAVQGAGVWSFVGRIDETRPLDFLAAVDVAQTAGSTPASRLHRVTPVGQLLWSYEPQDRLMFREGEYAAPWASWNVAPYRAGTEPRIAWAVHHYTWWPSVLISLTANGDRAGTFVNAGWISRTAGTPDGRHLAVTGMTNTHRGYFLAILDARDPNGSSPEPAGSPTECLSCPPGRPLHYFVFPRSDVGQAFSYPLDPPDVSVLPDGSVRVQVMETPGPSIGATVYEFDNDFSLRQIRTTDAFDEWHRRLEGSGALTHDAAACTHRRERDVLRWNAELGWQPARTGR